MPTGQGDPWGNPVAGKEPSGQIPKGEQPMCQKCFMPMIAVEAKLEIKQ